jgi:DNA-binding NtrC family response regulator
MSNILIVDDDHDVLTSARIFLKRQNFNLRTLDNPEQIPYEIQNFNPDVILLDMNFKLDITSGKEGIFWLEKIMEINPNISVIMITGYADIDKAVQCVKSGAIDFISKPWQNEKLLSSINAATQLSESKKEISQLKQTNRSLIKSNSKVATQIIGESESIKRIFSQIEKLADTDANVLILGENGTGKELVAKALHNLSSRKDYPIITVDLGLLQKNLFESELYGHKKGAFTDARETKIGKMELAHKGTLFLDEIGNLPIEIQPKLLRSLEDRTFQQLGSNETKKVDVRLVSATNSNISELIDKQLFRKDLLYRINTMEINLPPLREREEDSILIAQFYLELYSKKYNKNIRSISPSLKKSILQYSWPGNIRELRHSVERAVILNETGELNQNDLVLTENITRDEGEQINTLNLEEIEKNAIQRALKKNKGNISTAAKELGLTRAALYRRLDKFEL